jgi:hypothetical protein
VAKSDDRGKYDSNILPPELPPEIALLIPDPEKRELIALAYRLYAEEGFRTAFFADPATALMERGLSAKPAHIDSLQKMDKIIVDELAQQWREMAARTGALKMEDEGTKGSTEFTLVALLMAASFATGMVASHYLAHHLMEHKMRDI